FIRRGHPQDNGAHEQMHRILKADTASPPARSVRAQKRRIGAWILFYNQERPHEALDQQVPARFYRPSARRLPQQLKETRYPRAWKVRRVRNRGQIKWQGRQRFVGRAFVGELLGLKKMPNGSHEFRNATGFHSASSLKLCARPPLESKDAAWESAPEQTAAPPSSCWLVCSGALSTPSSAKVSPMS